MNLNISTYIKTARRCGMADPRVQRMYDTFHETDPDFAERAPRVREFLILVEGGNMPPLDKVVEEKPQPKQFDWDAFACGVVVLLLAACSGFGFGAIALWLVR